MVALKIADVDKEIIMFAGILIFILFVPAFLPIVLATFVSESGLNEMGISLGSTDDTFPMQGYELTGFLPVSDNCDVWIISEPLQTCPLEQ